MEPILLVVHY